MSFSNILRRKQGISSPVGGMPKRPDRATASAEFWRAFLGQDERRAMAPQSAAESARPSAGVGSAGDAGMLPDNAPSTEPAVIARELGLSRFASVRALQRLRREFALKNHPDRVPSTLRARATKRMMIANALIDSALKRFQFAGPQEPATRPFESGKRV